MTEKWLPISGFAGIYEVSDMGRVRSLDHITPCRWARHGVEKTIFRKHRGRILKPTISNHGYPTVMLGSTKTPVGIHILVLTEFRGPCPSGMEACHNNGKRTDNVLSNLRWDSSKGNHADKRLHGTLLFGEKANGAKLNKEKVKQIIAARGNLPAKDLATKYGVHSDTVTNIWRKRTWRHLQ